MPFLLVAPLGNQYLGQQIHCVCKPVKHRIPTHWESAHALFLQYPTNQRVTKQRPPASDGLDFQEARVPVMQGAANPAFMGKRGSVARRLSNADLVLDISQTVKTPLQPAPRRGATGRRRCVVGTRKLQSSTRAERTLRHSGVSAAPH